MSPRPRRRWPSLAGATLFGTRVALRPLSESDLRMVAAWYEGATEHRRSLKGAQGDDSDLGLLAITFREEDGAIGVMEYRVGLPEDGWLAFRFVAVEPRLRGLGLDSEAVRLMEDDALKRGLARRFWAGVQQGDGLVFYFWLRLGYRPARPDEDPWPGERRHDTIVMIRVPAV